MSRDDSRVGLWDSRGIEGAEPLVVVGGGLDRAALCGGFNCGLSPVLRSQ